MTAANAIFDIGTTPTRCASFEGMFVCDVGVLSVHMVRFWMLWRGFLGRGLMICRNGGC